MKQILLKTWLMLCLFLVVGIGKTWAETYTIDFNKGTTNGTSIGTQLAAQVSTMCQSGATNASSITGTNCYYQSNGCGIRLGKSGGAGSLVVTLSDAIKAENVTQVIVYASAVASGNALDVTPSGTVTAKTTFSDLKTYSTSSSASTNYELSAIDINGTLNTLTFEAASKKYVHLHRIDIITGTSHEVTGVEVNTSLTKSIYKVGDKFSTAGLTLTAHYDGADDKTITSGFTTSIANNTTLSEAGNKTVTVTYGEKTCNVNISVFALTSLAITTEATKTKYKASEKFNKAGMVVKATWGPEDNPNKITEDVTSSVTLNPTTTTALTSANDRIVVSYTHQGTTKTADQMIKVGDLNSISLTTAGVKTSYLEKDESFDPANLVVTAHYTNEIDDEDVTSSATYNPTTSTKLTLADDKVTVSYTWNSVTKTANLPITVNAGPKYTVTFDGGNGTPSAPSATETDYHGGVTLPSATCTHNGWNFAGWAEVQITEATATAPTLYEAGSKYYPTQPTTLYAVYSITEGGAPGTYKRAKSVSEVNAASTLVVVNGTNALNTSRTATTAPAEDANGVITPASTLILNWAGNSTDGYTLSNATSTLGASSIPNSGSSTNTAWTSSNNKWIVEPNTSGTNVFTMHIKDKTASLEYYSSNWKIYSVAGYLSNANVALKLYVPNSITAYTSVPAGAIIQPEVNFTTGEAHTIYLDANDKTYTDAATVTGVSKTATYESSKPAVATVDENGVVTALAIGTTTITAKVDAELGVSSAASDTYEITVKSASTIEGIKAITDAATVVDFTADLTDAVVTYVRGDHAYIQDASGAVYVSYSGHGLVAGKKINGAVSGKVKAANKIDQITSLTTSSATVTEDGVIPAAVVTTLASIVEAGAAYDGKLVTVNGASVKNSMTNTANSGASISDDDEKNIFNLYAPNKGVAVNATEIGNFTGFVSIYNGTSYRLNLYEQSQYVLTQNTARDQEISFATAAFAIDEDTEALTNFAGQVISGTAKGAVSYAKKEGDDIFTSINTETGAIALNGTCGTATIEATAAKTSEIIDGLTTPYNQTKVTYTVTVNPRYTVTFNMNGQEEEVREATYGAGVAVPTPDAIDGYVHVGWSADEVAATDEEPEMETIGANYMPTENTTFYAVYAVREGSSTDYTYTLDTNTAPYNSDGYQNGTKTVTATCPTDNTKTIDVTYQITNFGRTAGKLQMKKSGDGYMYNTTDLGSITSVTIADGTNLTTYYGTSQNPTSSTSVGTGNGYFRIVAGSSAGTCSSITVAFTKSTYTYSGYTTSIVPAFVNVTVGTAGISSYVTPYALDFTESDVKAYIVSAVCEDFVTLTSVEKIPAQTPIIVKGTADTYDVPTTSDATDDVSVNKLHGSTTTSHTVLGSDNIFALSASAGTFNHVKTGVAIPAGKSYLPMEADFTPNTSNNAGLRISFGGEATAIKGVDATANNAVRYNLNGQRISNAVKGIVIINGKKTMLR